MLSCSSQIEAAKIINEFAHTKNTVLTIEQKFNDVDQWEMNISYAVVKNKESNTNIF